MERVKPIQWVLSKDNSWKSAGALLHYAIIKHGGHWYIQYPNDDPLRRYNRPLWTFCDADSAKMAVAVHYEDYLYATLESILSQFEPEGNDSLSDEYLDFQEKKILRNYPQIKNLRPVGNNGWCDESVSRQEKDALTLAVNHVKRNHKETEGNRHGH